LLNYQKRLAKMQQTAAEAFPSFPGSAWERSFWWVSGKTQLSYRRNPVSGLLDRLAGTEVTRNRVSFGGEAGKLSFPTEETRFLAS
jgi:hypothetical protein